MCDDCHTALLGSAQNLSEGNPPGPGAPNRAHALDAKSSSSWLQAVVFPTPKEPAMIVTGMGESSGAMADGA